MLKNVLFLSLDFSVKYNVFLWDSPNWQKSGKDHVISRTSLRNVELMLKTETGRQPTHTHNTHTRNSCPTYLLPQGATGERMCLLIMSSLTIYNTHTHTLKLVAVSSHESLLGFIPAVTRQSSPQESQDDPDALCSAGKHHWFLLPATEFGRGIIRLDEFCVGYWMGPSDPTAPEVFLAVEMLRTPVPDVDASSSATGEHVSGRTCWAQLLILPSLPHSRLEPLRSSFSEELVMVAGREETVLLTLCAHMILVMPVSHN